MTTHRLTERQSAVRAYVAAHPGCTVPEIRTVLGLTNTEVAQAHTWPAHLAVQSARGRTL